MNMNRRFKVIVAVSFTVVGTLLLPSSEAHAKCTPRVCFKAKIQILTCVENPAKTKTLRETYSSLIEKGLKMESHLNDRHFDLSGTMRETKPCEGFYPGIQDGEIDSYNGVTKDFSIAIGDSNFCDKKRGVRSARVRTNCCDMGQQYEFECEKNLLVDEME